MKKEDNHFFWIAEGKIKDEIGFRDDLSQLILSAYEEPGTLIYWWSLYPNRTHYCEIDGYNDTNAALAHLDAWANKVKKFDESATPEKITVHGDVSDTVKEALKPYSPTYMKFYGGFNKRAPEGKANKHSDIMWDLMGEINNPEKFKEAMKELTSRTYEERGSLTNWWTVSEDGKKFHILERYEDTSAAMIHLETWKKYGNLLLEATTLESSRLFSPLTSDLAKNIASQNPIQMDFLAGFTK